MLNQRKWTGPGIVKLIMRVVNRENTRDFHRHLCLVLKSVAQVQQVLVDYNYILSQPTLSVDLVMYCGGVAFRVSQSLKSWEKNIGVSDCLVVQPILCT